MEIVSTLVRKDTINRWTVEICWWNTRTLELCGTTFVYQPNGRWHREGVYVPEEIYAIAMQRAQSCMALSVHAPLARPPVHQRDLRARERRYAAAGAVG